MSIQTVTEAQWKTRKVIRYLLRNPVSICPECGLRIRATIKEVESARARSVNGKIVIMEKTCPKHGRFIDILNTDSVIFQRMEEFYFDYDLYLGRLEDVEVPGISVSTEKRGMFPGYLSAPNQINIDLTTACNMRPPCPTCFADIEGKGQELSWPQVSNLIEAAYNAWPEGANGIQFTGGEPTVAKTFLQACRYAKSLGFKVVQAATNGLRFLDIGFCHEAKAAGLDGLYLQFDGLRDETYIEMRGQPLLEKKKFIVQNCRAAGLWIVFVPVLRRGTNEDEVGEIFKFAVKNAGICQGIAFQPESFTGRADYEQREAQRYTLGDMAWDLQEQTKVFNARRDFYSLSALNPLTMLMSIVAPKEGRDYLQVTSHPHCGLGSYVLVDRRSGKAVPITLLVDFEELIQEIHKLNLELISSSRKGIRRIKGATRAFQLIQKHFKRNNPLGISPMEFLKSLLGTMGHGRQRYYQSPWKFLMIGGMHFQDNFVYETARTERCVIMYAVPDPESKDGMGVKFVSFCAHNVGCPPFREVIEQAVGDKV